MAFIEWNKDMSVGVEALDEEHQIVVSLINQLHRSMEQGGEREVVEDTLDIMLHYTVLHFKREEEYFEKTDYPDIEFHKELHKVFTDEITGVCERYKNGELTSAHELTEFLKEWWINHIRGTDKQYTSYLNNVGIN